MKTIEERVADALAELEALLADGEVPEDAIPAAARMENLKPEVLRVRAERALGDLRTVKAKNDLRTARIAQQQKAKKALYEFADTNKAYTDFPDWFEDRIGRPPTKAEAEEMERLSWESLLRKVTIEI